MSESTRQNIRQSGSQRSARIYRGLALLLIALLAGCAGRTSVAETGLTGVLAIQSPATVSAGRPITIVITRTDAPEGTAVILVLQGSYGPLVYRSRFQGGRAEIRIPSEDTKVSGRVTLTARAGAAEGHADLFITPGTPVDPVTPLVGPRTIIADGAHWGTAAAIPFDTYGNPVAHGTPVEFRLVRPDGRVETVTTVVDHLVAWTRLSSATVAGRTTIVVAAEAARGPSASLIETPGWPVPFALSADPIAIPADGHRFLTLRTAPILDRFGNQMLDGTLVTFVASAPDDTLQFIPAYTIDGVAKAQLQAPASPGTLTVHATLYGVESLPLRIELGPGPAVGTFPLRAVLDRAAGVVRLEAGPLLGTHGQLVPEATVVHITLASPGRAALMFTSLIEHGYARIDLRLADLAPGSYVVDATAGAGVGQTRFTVP